jgi:hypothetical protein
MSSSKPYRSRGQVKLFGQVGDGVTYVHVFWTAWGNMGCS